MLLKWCLLCWIGLIVCRTTPCTKYKYIIATGSSGAVYSTNAGSTWHTHTSFPQGTDLSLSSWMSSDGWAILPGQVHATATVWRANLHSIFRSFSKVYHERFGDFSFIPRSPCFSGKQGYIIGASANPETVLLKTTNAGKDWSATGSITALSNSVDMKCFPSYQVISGLDASTRTLVIIRNDTTGKVLNATVTGLQPGLSVVTMAFSNDTHGWAAATAYMGKATWILQTTNGGFDWNFITKINNATLNKLQTFPSSSILYGAGTPDRTLSNPGAVMKSVDGGKNWKMLSTPVAQPQSIFFTSPLEGFLVGASPDFNNKILKTTNGGNSWEQLYSTSSLLLSAISVGC